MGSTFQKVRKPELPPLGERVADWVDQYTREHGLTASEFAWRIKADKRDIQRLMNERTCGPRLIDRLAAHFWPIFTEAVFAPAACVRRLEEIADERARALAKAAELDREFEAAARLLDRACHPRAGGAPGHVSQFQRRSTDRNAGHSEDRRAP